MKAIFTPTRLFISGFVLLLAVNVIVLLGVLANRSGKPEVIIELTERELALPYKMNDENSGLSLSLDWRILPEIKDDSYQTYDFGGHWGSPAWFNEQKIVELGFKIDMFTCPDLKSKRKKEPLPKDAYIVLEYDGNVYQEALKRAEQNSFKGAEKILEAERTSRSRLFAIDAGLDAAKLRERYADRSKFIILPGIVRLDCRYEKDKKVVMGSISDIRVDKINVPLIYRKLFDSIMTYEQTGSYNNLTSYSRENKSPRYKVELAYGSRFEPWIQRVEKLVK